MISASHNPFADNGIKFFAAGGRKLARRGRGSARGELDALLQGRTTGPSPAGDGVGDACERATERRRRYVDARSCDSIEGRRLDGLRVVIDCANGAASTVAPARARRARRRRSW